MSHSRNLSGCQVFRPSELPADWDYVHLKERLELLYGRALKEEVRKPGDVVVYGSNGKVGSHNAHWLDAPGVLVGRKGTVGAVHYTTDPFWPIDTTYYVKARGEDDLRFLFYLLDYLPLRILNAATGVPGLSRRDAYALFGAFPPPKEQAAIARVLDTVDASIGRAREAGAQARVARLALMQAAFNYELTSEDRQDTGAGRIPKSWEALKGKQAFSVLTGGNSSVAALRPLRADDMADAWFMKVDDFNLSANQRRIVTAQIGFVGRKNPTFRLLPIGTVVIAKRGAAILKNRVRTTAVPVALDPNLMALRVRDDILPEFFRYQLEWRNLARYVESSGVPQLNNKDLYPRWFVRAPEDQQREIVELIAAAERHEDALRSKLQSLEALKKSLMHDLLNGTVRVDPAILQEQQA